MRWWPFSRKPKQSPKQSESMTKREPGAVAVRRWESAETNRLNACHWAHAHGNSINEDLAQDLETLRARAHYEACNNPIVDGVIRTHQADIVGNEGPRLQVQSDNDQFNDLVESWWKVVCEKPEPSGRIQMPEMIRLWVSMLWKAGTYLNEEITYQRNSGDPVTLGVRTYHPRRLQTPPEFVNDDNVAFGVRLQPGTDVATQYYLRERESRGNAAFPTFQYRPVPADLIQCVYESAEPDQLIGIPWLASSLGTLADLRQADKHVMESLKNAAAQSIHWYNDGPEAEYTERDGDTDTLEPGTQSWVGGGWKPMMLQPTHPSAEFRPHRHERIRELGRPVGMPLMVVLLSSADSNFASAHYDGQVYMRHIAVIQSWIERMSLNHYVRKIARELVLAGQTTMPPKYALAWTWPTAPYVNPKQMYDALRAMLEDGTISYPDLLARFGFDEDSVIEKRKRTNEKLANADLPPLPVNHGRGSQPTERPEGEGDESNADADDETSDAGRAAIGV